LDHDGGSHDGLQCTIGESVVADHMAPRTWVALWNFKDYYLSLWFAEILAGLHGEFPCPGAFHSTVFWTNVRAGLIL